MPRAMPGIDKNLDGLLAPLISSLKSMEEKLKCLICKKFLQEPTLMTCDHIFCKECIPKYMVSLCPICKARFLSKNLRPALYIEEMLKIYQEMEASVRVINSYSVSPVAPVTGESERIPISQVTKTVSGSPTITQNGKAIAPIGGGKLVPVPPSIEKRANASATKDSCPVPGTSPNTNRSKRSERKELVRSSQKRLKPTSSKVPVGLYKDECIFCHSFRSNVEGLGKLLCIQDRKLVAEPGNAGKSKVLYAHENCLDWAPGIYYEGDQIMNLEREIRRTSKLICAKCSLNGAALGCFYEPCSKSYHPSCAFQIHGCRWDKENYNMLCPNHVSEKLLCDSGPPQSDTAANNKGRMPAPREPAKELGQDVHRQKSKPNALTQTKAHELNKGKMLVLLGLQLSQADEDILVQFLKKSSAILTKKWRIDVTHVVISSYDGQGFIKLRDAHEAMMAILHGTWIITIEWIKDSLQKGGGVPEEPYEVNRDFYGSLEGPRKGRTRATSHKALSLFARFRFLLSKDFPPDTKRRLKELLVAGGGEVMEEGGTPLLELGSSRCLLTTCLVYNGQSPRELGSDRRREQLLELAKRMRCSWLVSHEMVEEAIVKYDIEVFNNGWPSFEVAVCAG